MVSGFLITFAAVASALGAASGLAGSPAPPAKAEKAIARSKSVTRSFFMLPPCGNFHTAYHTAISFAKLVWGLTDALTPGPRKATVGAMRDPAPVRNLPGERCRALATLASDIDATITTAGMLPASTFQALWALDEAGGGTGLGAGRPGGG